MSNFYLVCGISGSGKTTLSEIISKQNNIKLFDVDKYYEMINGDECIRNNSFDIWIKIFQDIHQCELKGEDVLFTANSITIAQRRTFIDWFYTFKHHLIWVINTKEHCLEGNNNRKRHMPESMILEQWNEMEFPNPNEKDWTTITHITNSWELNKYIIVNIKGNIEDYIKI